MIGLFSNFLTQSNIEFLARQFSPPIQNKLKIELIIFAFNTLESHFYQSLESVI